MSLAPSLTRALNRPLLRSLTRAEVGGGDEFFDNVVLLLDFAGADEATSTTDLSNTPHTLTFVNSAQIDTALQYLGVNSLKVVGASKDHVVVSVDVTDFDFGTGDFTVEFGVRFTTTVSTQAMLSRYTSPGGWLVQRNDTADELKFFDGDLPLKAESWNPATDTWFHVAITRSGTDLRMFVDGTQLGTPTTDSTDFSGIGTPLLLGGLTATLQNMTGYIGAVRVTKGVARYTANFTAPTEFYPTS